MGMLGLNRDVLVAIGASLAVSTAVAHHLGDADIRVNATLTSAADYGTFFSVFAASFYVSNRKKYQSGDGTDRIRLYSDLRRLAVSMGAAEIVYIACRWVLLYLLLGAGYEAYAASIMSQAASTAIYLAALNTGARITRLYR